MLKSQNDNTLSFAANRIILFLKNFVQIVDKHAEEYARIEKCFYTPHFFDRYKERTGLSADMSKVDVMKDWIMKNIHLNSDAQSSEK